MKHLKTYKLFESDNFDWFKELFINLEDDGFGVTIKESKSTEIDFSKSKVVDSHDLLRRKPHPIYSKVVNTIDVKVEKRVIEDGQLTLRTFNIDEIKETLEFAESYAKEELGLQIEYIYIMRVPRYLYFSSIDDLPNNQDVDSVTFAFRKKD